RSKRDWSSDVCSSDLNNLINYNAVHKRTYYIYTFLERFHFFSSDQCHIPFVPLIFLCLQCFSSLSMHLQDVFPNVLPLLNYPLATRATLWQGLLLSVEPSQGSVESQHQKNVLNQLHHQIVPYVLD